MLLRANRPRNLAVGDITKEDVAEAETSVKEVAKRKQRRRRVPLPQIAAGDQIFLVDVPTPGEAISPLDEQGDPQWVRKVGFTRRGCIRG